MYMMYCAFVYSVLSPRSMDSNGTMTIDWNEWKNYPSSESADNFPEIILYWKHSTVSSIYFIIKYLQKLTVSSVDACESNQGEHGCDI